MCVRLNTYEDIVKCVLLNNHRIYKLFDTVRAQQEKKIIPFPYPYY